MSHATIRRFACSIVVLLFSVAAASGQSVQAPGDFLGHRLGEQFTHHHRVVDYVTHVAAQSDRVQLERYGQSYEGRPLLATYISTPENLARLKELRTAHLQRIGLTAGAAAPPNANTPAIVWLSYNVHGNESVSTEAAMSVLHRLATRTGDVQEWLQNVIVVLDPCLNPDGRERYVHWYERTRGMQPNASPQARSHHEPWHAGRSNHYYFDLNRDWAWAVQQETRQRLALYNTWMPHIHVDFHEQGYNEPYYFAPAAEPIHENVTAFQRRFQETVGLNNARYFDRNGWLYFTGEVFDLFYPGYGDTWPLFNGAIGMTYEQGGIGAGLAVRTAAGDTLTLDERIAHHRASSLATIETAATHRGTLVQEFIDYYRSGQDDPPGHYAAYLVKATTADRDRIAALHDHLTRQGIVATVARAAAGRVQGTRYHDGLRTDVQIAAGDLVVPAQQPKARLTKVLMEPRPTIIDSVTYDITAWTLPYAYGLEAYGLSRAPQVAEARAPTGPSAPAEGAPYAYVVAWKSLADVAFVGDLLEQGLQARIARQGFALRGTTYARGTLIFTRADNKALGEAFDRRMRRLADTHDQPIVAAATGLVDQGPDFGSANVPVMDRPTVATLGGPPASSYDVGEVWHFFDQTIAYPLTLLPPDDFAASMLDDVDVLILPGGYGYADWMTSARRAALVEWVRNGGQLIALGRANHALAGHKPFALKAKPPLPDTSALDTYGTAERTAAMRGTPGSIHLAQLDTTHPLAAGLGARYYSLKTSGLAFSYLSDGWNVATLPTGTPLAGFIGTTAQQRIAETLVFGTQPLGEGTVVYFADNPLFRGFWYGGQMAFSNAVFQLSVP
ncbi:M14 family metallopeptidase [Salisaeta longa]|uniref:M14 family metallopeptidase n=1 Tax=Salisaeta longa TaxID=503170 RepID=UPI0003B4999D|nr:M14 family metallopeptidase [Salisaeta longa]